MAELSLKHIDKVYDNNVQAVFDFNLDIKDKEFIVFVGPSGCGKSTTLRMIAGLEDITAGELSIDGKVVNDVEPKDRDIAMVFQSYALYPHMSCLLYTSREKIKGQNFFRIVFYIPNILSVVVIAAIFGAIYNPTTGLLNSLFDMLSLPGLKQMWMGNSNIALYSLAAALVWQAIGYYMVMYMASMSSIPENLYEAASLEGAGRMKQFFLVTLPLVWDNIRTTLTFFIISTINLSFLFVKIMTGGGPNGATEVFLSYMYNQAYTCLLYTSLS